MVELIGDRQLTLHSMSDYRGHLNHWFLQIPISNLECVIFAKECEQTHDFLLQGLFGMRCLRLLFWTVKINLHILVFLFQAESESSDIKEVSYYLFLCIESHQLIFF